MKNRFGLVAAWFLATALAVGVASQAVGLVADRAVGIPVQVPVAVGGQSAIGPLTSTPTDPPPPTTTTTTPPPTSSPTTLPATGATTTTVATATTTTTTIPPTTTTTTTTSLPPLDSRTFFPPGGQVSVACTGPETIKYLGAVPQSGWTVELESSGPEKVKVEFHSDENESEIEIRCHQGQLEEEISD